MKSIFTVFVFIISMNSYAQQSISTPIISVTESYTTNWVTYVSTSDFIIEYRFDNCDPSQGFDFEGVIFKITNLTTQKIAFSWHKLLYYAGSCRTCDYPEEYSFTISVEANSSVEGDCDPNSGYNLKLFSKFIDQAYSQGDQLTTFQLGNLTTLTTKF